MNSKTLVIVDAGHGGLDGGASGNDLIEKNEIANENCIVDNNIN